MTFTEQATFNFEASEAAKDAGMLKAAENKASLLAHARKVAVELAKQKGQITADDVQLALSRQGISVRALGNAAGSLFRGKEWVWTGQMRKSEREHAHCNLLRVWRLK